MSGRNKHQRNIFKVMACNVKTFGFVQEQQPTPQSGYWCLPTRKRLLEFNCFQSEQIIAGWFKQKGKTGKQRVSKRIAMAVINPSIDQFAAQLFFEVITGFT